MKRSILSILISLLCVDGYAQTIADIAKRERERRAVDEQRPAADTRAPLITLTVARPTSDADIGGLTDDVFRFYDVRGTTAAELRADVARLGPISEGSRQQGFTNWNITWNPATSPSGGKCRLTAVNVLARVEIVIPRWANEVGAQISLSESWRRYLTGLLLHEHGHKDIALAGAEELRQLPQAATPQATCAAAEAAANAAGAAILEKTKARQRQYDKDTEHGRGQGVRLP